jgi:hypothetical protein
MLVYRARPIEVVQELGLAIEEAWRVVDYDTGRFPEIAARALADAALPRRLTPDEIVRWALGPVALPRQRDIKADFGQPPLTLFHGRRFYVDALHWIDGTTSIHQHSFSGAFQVLAGSSIETQYAFEPSRVFNAHFMIGRLDVTSTRLHRVGDVTPIRSGPHGLRHSLFHLDRPSITIVARTPKDAGSDPQLSYTRSGIAVDPFFTEDAFDRSIQLVRYLCSVAHPDLESLVGDLIGRSDVHTAYRVLEACLTAVDDRSLLERLCDRVRDAEAAALFRAAFEEIRRTRFLQARRAVVREPELRFFLAVLLNAPRRREALALVAAFAGDRDPARQIAAWVRQLSNVTLKLQAASGPWQPNLLGLPPFTDELEAALANELSGGGGAPDGAAGPALTALRGIPALNCLFA